MTQRRVGLVEAMESPELLNMHLYPGQRQLAEGWERTPNAVTAAGRRGGKTFLAAGVAVYDATLRPDLDELVRAGETRYSICVATNLDQGRRLLESARLIAEASPTLAPMLEASTTEELRFRLPGGRRSAVRAFPCSSRGIRGWAVSSMILDEAAHFVSTEDGDATAERVYSALRPATAQFGDRARVLLISSPMGTDGFFARQFKRAQEGSLPGWEAYQLTTAELNETITEDFLEQVEAEEPDTYASEYLAQFESGGNLFFDLARIRIDPELEEAQPADASEWAVGLDPGYASDSFGVALLGKAGDRLVLGPVRAIEPDRSKRRRTFEFRRAAEDRVTAEVAELCLAYGARAYTDQHLSQAVVSRTNELGLHTSTFAMTRQSKYSAFKELRDFLYAGTLVLPAHTPLLEEIQRVRVKLEQAGPKIILPRSSKGHCDQIQALAVAAWMQRFVGAKASSPRARKGVTLMPGGERRLTQRELLQRGNKHGRAGQPDPDRPGQRFPGGRGWDRQF